MIDRDTLRRRAAVLESSIILIGSGTLVCLMPVAIYFLYLANLNGKPHPILVPGGWDFTATLLGLSGFILISGPLFLTLIDARWRATAFGNWDELRTLGAKEGRAWSLISAGYLLLLLGIIPGLIRLRRSVTSVYNVRPAELEAALASAFTGVNMAFTPGGPAWHLSDAAGRPAGRVTVEGFRALNHAVLKWGGVSAERRALIESAIEKALAHGTRPRSAVAGWMSTAAVTVMLVMLFWMVLLVVLMVSVG